jgi:zinc and cadmium transporter
LPHAVEQLGSAKQMAHWMMVGIVMMFVLIRLFHFHNHEPVSPASPALATCSHGHDHDHDHSHDHDVPEVVALGTQQTQTGKGHTAAECHSHGHAHGMSWMGIALGLSLHTLIEGLALGASVHADSQRMAAQSMLGFGTFLAIVLHKPLDSVSITALMLSSNWNSRTINLVNIGFALMCPIGAVLVLMGVSQFSGMQRELLGTALSFAAGVFICIALSDLLPEMEFHAHNKVQLTVALGLGIALSWALTLLESGHLH